jgi:hypothetical protein
VRHHHNPPAEDILGTYSHWYMYNTAAAPLEKQHQGIQTVRTALFSPAMNRTYVSRQQNITPPLACVSEYQSGVSGRAVRLSRVPAEMS